MSKLPRISGKECVRALENVDFYVSDQTGSHIHIRRDKPKEKVTVPIES